MLIKQNSSFEMCRINADGTTVYDWAVIEEQAAKWRPYCDDTVICVAKLLLPLKPAVAAAEQEIQ
jgi:hypothetical protein